MDSTECNLIKSEACLSECGKYRYWLSRIWNESGDIGAFVCTNPSKATSLLSDTTLSNCNNLAVQWGWGGFYIINIFAYMATNQNDMRAQADPNGPKNDEAITSISNTTECVVLAWGNGHRSRSNQVLELLSKKKLYCIKRNTGGGFLHPSRIKSEDYAQPVAI
ncbi:DUF1643 domain-containing protein [Marinobacter sp. BW6]|uniref:DUF1643 domain-containing protein n=1 Tax=Marinobacter sp. BW6 TaxID=2592624 RepID=UPI0013968A8E|nr:DUF1643 domain-containing protein [Marinobacter sp. BW6]